MTANDLRVVFAACAIFITAVICYEGIEKGHNDSAHVEHMAGQQRAQERIVDAIQSIKFAQDARAIEKIQREFSLTPPKPAPDCNKSLIYCGAK